MSLSHCDPATKRKMSAAFAQLLRGPIIPRRKIDRPQPGLFEIDEAGGLWHRDCTAVWQEAGATGASAVEDSA